MMSTPFKIMDENENVVSSRAKNVNIMNNNNNNNGSIIKGGGAAGLSSMNPALMSISRGRGTSGNTDASSPLKPTAMAPLGGKEDSSAVGSKTARKALVDLSHSQASNIGGGVNGMARGAFHASTPVVQRSNMGGIPRGIMTTGFKSNKKPKMHRDGNVNSISVFQDATDVAVEKEAENSDDVCKYDADDMVCTRMDRTIYSDPYDMMLDCSNNLHFKMVTNIADNASDNILSGYSGQQQSASNNSDLYYFDGNYSADLDDICRRCLESDNNRGPHGSNSIDSGGSLCCEELPEMISEEPFDNFNDI